MKLGITPGGGSRPGPRSMASIAAAIACAVALGLCAMVIQWAILQRLYSGRRVGKTSLEGRAVHICDPRDLAGSCGVFRSRGLRSVLWRRGYRRCSRVWGKTMHRPIKGQEASLCAACVEAMSKKTLD